MIDRIAEATGEDATSVRQALAAGALFLGALVLALVLIGGWAAAVLYLIVPLRLEGVGFIRGVLAIGGAVVVGGAYLIGLYAAVSS